MIQAYIGSATSLLMTVNTNALIVRIKHFAGNRYLVNARLHLLHARFVNTADCTPRTLFLQLE